MTTFQTKIQYLSIVTGELKTVRMKLKIAKHLFFTSLQLRLIIYELSTIAATGVLILRLDEIMNGLKEHPKHSSQDVQNLNSR